MFEGLTIWNTVTLVSSGITLVAFLVALGYQVLKVRLSEREKLIKSALPKDRAKLVNKTLEFFDVDTENLSNDKRFQIAMEQIKRRAERFRLIIIVVIIFGILASGIAVFSIWQQRTKPSEPPKSEKSDSNEKSNSFEFKSIRTDTNGNIVETINGKANIFLEDLGSDTNLEMVEIPAGTFLMGTKNEDIKLLNLVAELQRYYPDNCAKDLSNAPCKEEVAKWTLRETPAHLVTIAKPFYMGKFEITQKQWRMVARLPMINFMLNEDPSVHKGDDRPVESISWREANEFCERLSKRTGRHYRLPTEAEWEYASRAGTQTQFSFGENIQPGIANYRGWGQFGSAPRGLDRQTTVAVGGLGYANRFGLYDMTGNVWEWCQDTWHENYDGAPTDGSAWIEGGEREYRVVRGGSWWWIAYGCRSAYRNSREESQTSDNDPQGRPRGNHGFRVILTNI